jgi:hypothetical protein
MQSAQRKPSRYEEFVASKRIVVGKGKTLRDGRRCTVVRLEPGTAEVIVDLVGAQDKVTAKGVAVSIDDFK